MEPEKIVQKGKRRATAPAGRAFSAEKGKTAGGKECYIFNKKVPGKMKVAGTIRVMPRKKEQISQKCLHRETERSILGKAAGTGVPRGQKFPA